MGNDKKTNVVLDYSVLPNEKKVKDTEKPKGEKGKEIYHESYY